MYINYTLSSGIPILRHNGGGKEKETVISSTIYTVTVKQI